MANSLDEKFPARAAQTSGSPISLRRSSFDVEKQEHLDTGLVQPPEFDPMATANPCSPFYLYKHDSPRPSTEQFKSNSSAIHISVHDLESASTPNLTPYTTRQEKCQSTENGQLRLWPRTKQCMTKPKRRSCQWLANLSRWQRLLIKIVFAMMIVGGIVGLAVGISIRVHGGVNSGMNDQTSLPS